MNKNANLNLPIINNVAQSIYQQGSYTPDTNTSLITQDNNTMDDNGVSAKLLNDSFTTDGIYGLDYFKGIRHSKNLFNSDEIDLYNKTYRFGLFNPNTALSGVREVLFFTKPDLSILSRNDTTGEVYSSRLTDGLAERTFWQEMFAKRMPAIKSLQGSIGGWKDPFNHLLQNTVSSNLEIPGLSSDGIETTKNAYGVNITYRASSESSNDSFDFSLEFKDTKWLDVYYFFRMYEEYETLKHHGLVSPWRRYITSKVLHDQFAIYKFLLDDDNETILYFAKFWGVYPKSLPRDTFGNTNFETGITYSIDFKGQFFDDADPIILREFNDLAYPLWHSESIMVNTATTTGNKNTNTTADKNVVGTRSISVLKNLDVYNDMLGRIDGRPATVACVVQEPAKRSPTGYVYKLKWKGSDNA